MRYHFGALISMLLLAFQPSCGGASGERDERPAPAKRGAPEQDDDREGDGQPASRRPADSGQEGDPATGSPGQDQGADESPNVVQPVADPGQKGAFAVRSYTQGLADPAYASAVVYYPEGSSLAAKLPATTLSGGYTNTKEQMVWLAEHLASHGFVVIVFTPTNNRVTDPGVWATGHAGSLAKIKAESGRQGSPLQGRIDEKRLGVMGFSMGGAGAIVAVNQLGPQVRAAVPICAYRPESLRVDVPTMFVTGTNDTVASPTGVVQAFSGSRTNAPRALANFNGLGHGDIIRTATFRPRLARYMTAWFQLQLAGNKAYEAYLTGDALQNDRKAGVFAGDGDFQLVP